MPQFDFIPVTVLSIILVLTAVRQVGAIRLGIWQIMLGGAAAVILSGSAGLTQAASSIDIDVMLFLFGMFVVGEALVESGYLYHVSYGFFKRAQSADTLVIAILAVMGFFSAFLMNDTVAVIGTPLVLFFAEKHNISHKLLLLTLCFAITLGSVVSPIGNPQNLLIALNGGIENPFVTFFRYLALPTGINLVLAYVVLKVLFREHFHNDRLDNEREAVRDKKLAGHARLSLALVFILVAAKVLAVFLFPSLDFRLTYIALISAMPILLFSSRRTEILRKIDWHTLIFFASLFILMGSVWDSGVIQYLMDGAGAGIGSTGLVLATSVLLSQLLSNVPFVALYLPLLTSGNAGVDAMMALAAGSTIAGNLFILGAASNIIIIQNAEKRGGHTITFLEFAKAGVPLTVLNTLVYWIFLRFF